MRYRRRTKLPARFMILCVVVEFLIVGFTSIAVAEAQEDERFDFIIKSDDQHIGTAVYVRDLPGPKRVWLDGDRVGYSKIYAFLDCNTANKTLNMRVSAFAYDTVVGATIFDKFMDEGSRRWGGAIEADGEIPAKESNAPDRELHTGNYPESVPVIEIHKGNTVCETRDYHNVVEGDDVTWAVIEESKTEVIVGWYVDGETAVEFYYEIIGGAYRLRTEET